MKNVVLFALVIACHGHDDAPTATATATETATATATATAAATVSATAAESSTAAPVVAPSATALSKPAGIDKHAQQHPMQTLGLLGGNKALERALKDSDVPIGNLSAGSRDH
ncbi:MAG TPA: hypothetical protein VGH28_15535 [Polyangiaceae bacterium]